MPRQPKLRKVSRGRKQYWATGAGKLPGHLHYFGPVEDIPRQKAQVLFAQHLVDTTGPARRGQREVSVAELVGEYQKWWIRTQDVESSTIRTKCKTLDRFVNFTIPPLLPNQGDKLGDIPTPECTEDHVTAFLGKKKPTTKATYTRYIKSVWKWGRTKGNMLPANTCPFDDINSSIRRHKITGKDFIRVEEIEAILATATTDFKDLLTVLWETGARPKELIDTCVENVWQNQIELKEHKRAKSTGRPRVIYLTPGAFEIIQRRMIGKRPQERVFLRPMGSRGPSFEDMVPWTTMRADDKFKQIRTACKIRSHLTPYCFRHLWISEALMQDIPVAQVAEMAGTSINEIERTYGHFFTEHLHEHLRKMDNRISKRKRAS